MAIDFPASPTTNQTYTFGTKTWTYNGTAWQLSTTSNVAFTNVSQTFTSTQSFSSQIISTLATGTAPFSVTSTTVVTNLNANYLNGVQAATANTVSTIVARDASGAFAAGAVTAASISASTLTSTVATGTAPFTVTSTTAVANLTANAVSQSIILKADSGTTEGTDLYTYSGGTAKTLNIVAGTNITITKTTGQWSIASSGGSSGFIDQQALTFNYR